MGEITPSESGQTAAVSYDAFLSYSHADRTVARRISNRLRRYKPPRASRLRKRLAVFRDIEQLTTAESLRSALTEHVANSRHLVLLASPSAASSPYVDQEVRAMLDRRGPEALLIVLLDGELQDALPPSARDLGDEPLYIDLRGADRSVFRWETLRLIASLYGVEYSRLRRQDEARARRRLAAAVSATVVTLLAVASGYLIVTTPAENWREIPQPVTETWSNALAPVRQVAVSRRNPNTVVWFGRNARHARDLDSSASFWGLTIFDGLSEAFAFEERARHQTLTQPLSGALATLSLSARDGRGDPLVSVTSQIFGIRDGERAIFVTRSAIENADDGVISTPLVETTPTQWLDSLSPEPAQTLLSMGHGGRDLAGDWTDATRDDIGTSVDFTGDRSSEAREVLDAVAAPEFLLFSNDPREDSRLRVEQESERADDLWRAEFAESDDWLGATDADAVSLSFTGDELSRLRDAAGSDPADLEGSLARAHARLDLPVTDFSSIRVVTAGAVRVATIRPIRDSHEVVEQEAPINLFRSAGGDWQPLDLPGVPPRTAVEDARAVDSSPQQFYLVTDRAGLFRSLDGGRTWEEANFGEPALTRAPEVALIVAPGPTVYVHALLYEGPSGGINPLFRFELRGWFTRWRVGLARLLETDP